MPITLNENNHKVVKHTPFQDWLFRAIVLITFLSILFFAYSRAERYAAEKTERLENLNTHLQDKINTIQAKHQESLQALAIARNAQNVDNLSLENLRVIIRKLIDEKAELNKELAFYRSIIAPENVTSGVRVHTLDLLNGNAVRKFHLRLTVAQVSRANSFLKGNVSVTIEGHFGNAEKKSLSLFELAGEKASSLPLAFRYFQVLPGQQDFFEFTLPEGFTPKIIRVVARISNNSAQNFNESFEWNKELTTNVGQRQKE
ncbi:MAG: hypothetical protein QS748_14290 [Candidatus Endonucleobacter bathymodioli]|uniref:Transmembrane protein n=1 Tax=Candidatus Endonucleibacter bathymodioli TaxID=539814 RepID=A0AA90NVW8_9GAMM|nr:hypothetical protein [Candidatus Endonucleobacter bathymodioli]